MILIICFKLGDWCLRPSGSPSIDSSRYRCCAGWHSVSFVLFFSSYLMQKQAKTMFVFELHTEKSNFSWTSTEGLQGVQKAKLENLFVWTDLCTQDLNTTSGRWDMSKTSFLSCYSKVKNLVDLWSQKKSSETFQGGL